MKLSTYIGGIIGLTKDFLRFGAGLLVRPHYVAVLLAVIIGVFYVCGVSPREIPAVVAAKWDAFVADRKEVFGDDLKMLSRKLGGSENAVGQKLDSLADDLSGKQDIVSKQPEMTSHVNEQQQMFEEKFGWQQAFKSQNDLPQDTRPFIEGQIAVAGADKIRIGNRLLTLRGIRVLPGKAGEAYKQMMHRFNGVSGKCFFENENDDRADCFSGSLGISEMLVDFGLAEKI